MTAESKYNFIFAVAIGDTITFPFVTPGSRLVVTMASTTGAMALTSLAINGVSYAVLDINGTAVSVSTGVAASFEIVVPPTGLVRIVNGTGAQLDGALGMAYIQQ